MCMSTKGYIRKLNALITFLNSFKIKSNCYLLLGYIGVASAKNSTKQNLAVLLC